MKAKNINFFSRILNLSKLKLKKSWSKISEKNLRKRFLCFSDTLSIVLLSALAAWSNRPDELKYPGNFSHTKRMMFGPFLYEHESAINFT